MPFLDTEGASIHYRCTGTGKPLLMLPGMMSDGSSWAPVIEPLSRSRQLILIDHRCTGQSTANPDEISRTRMLDDILRLMDVLELDSVDVLGHSMGGMLGWALAASAPERVSCLVAAAALPTIPKARVEMFESLVDARRTMNLQLWYRLLFQWLFSAEFFEDSDRIDTTIDAACHYPYQQSLLAFEKQVSALTSFEQALPLDRIRCPVHCMTGSNDLLLTPARLRQFHATMHTMLPDRMGHGSRLRVPVVIDEAAHALHWEQPAAFLATLESMLAPTDR